MLPILAVVAALTFVAPVSADPDAPPLEGGDDEGQPGARPHASGHPAGRTHPRFNKIGKTILRHHKRTKIIVGLGTLRTDGRYWSGPGDWSFTTLIR